MPKLDLVARATASSRRTGTAFQEEPVHFRPVTVLANDPGQRNCGMAWFHLRGDTRTGGSGGDWPPGPLRDDPSLDWICDRTVTVEPFECLDLIQAQIVSGEPTVFVIEEYRLYPDKMQQQGMSSLGVVEVIGAIKWFILAQNEPERLAVVMQGASIKDAGCRRLGGGCVRQPRKGLSHDPSVHVGHNIHSRDAESHGVYWTRVKAPALWRPRARLTAG